MPNSRTFKINAIIELISRYLPKNGTVLDPLEDADTLRNNLYQSRHYGVMSRCMAAGMNSGFDDGVCRIYRIDKTECSCLDMFTEFEEILKKEALTHQT